jgi:branched-chain amino acid transport system ATP-binding protein
MTLLALSGVSIAYGGVPAVQDVSLRVAAGSIVTVIGANGAGKTTLLSAIAGILPCRGEMAYDGAPMPATVEARVNAGIALVPESRALFASMAVEDNLRLGGWRLRRSGRAAGNLDRVYALFPRLRERRRQAAGTLSGGERQMVALGRALMAEPRLLLLDEPSLGLAPLIVRDILATISALRQTGMAVLLIEQNARAALRIADYGYVMETGRVTLEGDSAALESDPRVLATYLGGGP